MKRKYLRLIVSAILLLSIIPLSAHAHRGNTDGAGGHTDHSTGEYHYHHGYPAHDHYDVDGDGVLDCPYDFDDQTRHNANSSSKDDSESNHSSSFIPPTIPVESSQPIESTATEEKEDIIVPIWCFIPLIFIIVWQWASIRQKKDDIDYWRNKNDRDKENIISEYEAKLQKQKDDYDSRIAASGSLEIIRSRISSARNEYDSIHKQLTIEQQLLLDTKAERRCLRRAPLDVCFNDDGMPVYWESDPLKPYGDYTVFMSPNSKIYHRKQYCSSYHADPHHIFDVVTHARPCKKCAEGFFDFSIPPEWYTASDELDFQKVMNDPNVRINWRN